MVTRAWDLFKINPLLTIYRINSLYLLLIYIKKNLVFLDVGRRCLSYTVSRSDHYMWYFVWKRLRFIGDFKGTSCRIYKGIYPVLSHKIFGKMNPVRSLPVDFWNILSCPFLTSTAIIMSCHVPLFLLKVLIIALPF